MTQELNRRYNKAIVGIWLSLVPAYCALLFIDAFVELRDAKPLAANKVVLAHLVAFANDIGGEIFVLMSGILFLFAAVFCAAYGFRALRKLRSEFGTEAVDDVELSREREWIKSEVLIGRMPAHLASVEAFRAHDQRVRKYWILWLLLLIVLIGTIVLPSIFG